ncbi:MAG: DUF1190 domain-containing protein [Rhodospirillales bacterium]|nr:DUF1190 domain-containing protein [Rhodospirillales bacterium]
MKNVTSFKFTLLGATALVLTLASCDDPQEAVLAYNSVESCVNAGLHDQATCEAEFKKAEEEHMRSAPRYRSATDCYSDFGYDRCYRPTGSSIWLPFMMGYMMAPRGGVGSIYSQPLYRPSDDPNRFYTSGNSRLGSVSAKGETQVAQAQTKRPAARTRTVSRGGFGARAVSSSGRGFSAGS